MTLSKPLPPCGLYRTGESIGEVPAGRLVYFHNHGEPGAGVYLPERWQSNRARFHAHGHTLPHPALAFTLVSLAAEGFYAVVEPFYCCEQKCRRFEPDDLVQLGYDGAANPLLFTPELVDGQMALPELGTRIDEAHLQSLRKLRVAESGGPSNDAADDGGSYTH